MKECPRCGTIDAPYWLPRPFDRETDLIKTEDLARIAPKLEARLPEATVTRCRIGSAGEKMDLVDGVYVYRRTMKSPYVLRLWLPLYQYRHGFSVPPGYWEGLSRRRWMKKLCSQFGRRMYLKGVSLGVYLREYLVTIRDVRGLFVTRFRLNVDKDGGVEIEPEITMGPGYSYKISEVSLGVENG